MIPNPPTVPIPSSYESLPLTHVKVSHHPAGSPEATPVVVVTLNRPDKHNAFTIEMMDDFEKIYPMFDIDERVKVVVLTGAGKIFCAGADLERGFKGEKERTMDHRDAGGRLALAIHRCRKPTIAAMQGSAVGLGMTMTLPAAIRIACDKAKYGFVFPRRGLTMESSSSFFLPRLIGYSHAMYLLTTGGVFPPASPHFGSLFAETYPDSAQVVSRALELATEIAENVSPMASYLSRQLMWRGPATAEESHLVDSAVLYHMFSGRDQQEGVQAFFEKRRPHFKATLEDDAPPNFPWWTEVDTGRRAKGQSKL
ncbi:ClpP/crotonase [Aspergillus steynii IBT 23096]|uniref:ClpP/crotonase n=1 Tax=Aspergillus steynii IBT 23096 TaxID=1392250 RepID=A0A2I2G3J9_9EURO|nr:ClpP/crotonase [Aspergillus steynii IBT 23096]PLB47451.1 ClpP/crotonase [Aspergillus steynii IBT 23096]